MANTSKKSSDQSSDESVVRIKAGASTSKKSSRSASTIAKPTKPVAKPQGTKASSRGIRGGGLFRPIGGYFKGAWYELRQVRWPNRRATWSLTGAVLAYSAFFIIIVLLLDALFKYLFELVLGK